LENVIKRAIILTKGSVISPELLFEGTEIPVFSKTPDTSSRLGTYLNQDIISREGEIFKLAGEEFEKDLLKWALIKTGGNQVKAAKILGISRVMLHERIEKYGLKG
jgi:two-component system NtrC family response regulator